MWGNVLYERSLLVYKKGEADPKETWDKLLLEGVKKFKLANCADEEISSALNRHEAKDKAWEVVRAAGIKIAQQEEAPKPSAEEKSDEAKAPEEPEASSTSS